MALDKSPGHNPRPQAEAIDTLPPTADAASLRDPLTTLPQWPPHYPIEAVLGQEQTEFLIGAHNKYSLQCDRSLKTALDRCLFDGPEKDVFFTAANAFYSTAKMVNTYRAIKIIHQNIIWSLFVAGEGAFLIDGGLREFLDFYNKSSVVSRILSAYLNVPVQALYGVITDARFSWNTRAGA